jgi:hypothetical protein
MHDNADGGRGRGRVAPVHQLSLSILSFVFVYTLSYGFAKQKLRVWVVFKAFVVRCISLSEERALPAPAV